MSTSHIFTAVTSTPDAFLVALFKSETISQNNTVLQISNAYLQRLQWTYTTQLDSSISELSVTHITYTSGGKRMTRNVEKEVLAASNMQMTNCFRRLATEACDRTLVFTINFEGF